VPPPPDNEAIIQEAYLLAQIGVGDRDAFRKLYTRYSAPLLSLAVRLVGNLGESEEMIQDAFMKIWRNAASYDARKSRPFTWAVTITRRTCIDHLRKRRRLPETTTMSDEAEVENSGGDSVRGLAEAREDSERLREALAQAPRRQRQALELALFSEMTHTEIAEVLQQPIGTVKSWIRRGLLDLRETLADTTL
jgi:RNA polymerase sigma-70 factor (ECF subfamily)